MQNSSQNRTKILINENSIGWGEFLSGYSPKVEYYNISNKFNRIAFDGNIKQDFFDVYLFDINDNLKDELTLLEEIKKYNPSIKTIVLTSEKNRKYRSQLALKVVDHFMFREHDMKLLHQILNVINLHITRTRYN